MNLNLKCCGKENPIGVDQERVRLHFETDGSGEIVSYTIEIKEQATGKSICTLSGDGFTVWVPSAVLQERTAYTWQVSAKLSDGAAVQSHTACFETGVQMWQGKWIGTDAQSGRVLEFRKKFAVKNSLRKARLYICGLGYFQPKLNGQKLTDSYFIPPVTDYATRPQLPHATSGHHITYYTYDVTKLLQAGENVLGAEVADGYYSNWEKAHYEPQPDMSFGQSGLIYELHIEDEDGTHCIFSDEQTSVRSTNAVSRLYSGDEMDYAREPEVFQPAVRIPAPDGLMTSPVCADDRLYQVLSPVNSWKTPEGTVYDFGVNHSGGLQFTALSAGKETLRIRFAEVLHNDGTLNFETGTWHSVHIETGKPRSIYQGNTYHLQEGSNVIAPGFSWFCYRYALIESKENVEIQDVKSLFICMDLEQNGEFSCAESTLNRINEMFLHTLRCNMHSGILSDCPHRERLPYTGDGGVVMKSVCYNLSALDFYYKWFRDLLDAQHDNGLIPNTATHLGGGGGYAWGNALCVVTKELYALTGDLTVATEGYEAIKKWLNYYESKRDADYIIRSNSHNWLLGDWLAPEVVTSNVYYISTVCYLQAVKTALFLAEILEPAACQKWKNLQSSIADGINRVFFDRQKLTYGNGVQGENMLALAEDIVPQAYQQQMEQKVRHHYTEETDYHLDTGIVLTPVLINYLTDRGFRDVAFRIMTAETYPSYFSLMEGETTFSEHWSKKWPDYYIGEIGKSELVKGGGDLSHCHPMYGSVVAWLYERVAGLDLCELYRKTVHIKPFFMDCLDFAAAKKQTAFGEVSVAWRKEQDRYTMEITIPHGLTAQCCFPATCRYLQIKGTKQCYYPDEQGYFRFSLDAGQWELTN